METGMPHWRNQRRRPMAPIEHLSADRLGDMVNAERSNPPDLATLPRTHREVLDEPAEDLYRPPSAFEARCAPPPPPPVEIAPDYTWHDALPPVTLPAHEQTTVNVPEMFLPEVEFPVVPERASAPSVAKGKASVAKKKAKKAKGGRHRQPASLSHFGRALARSLRAAVVAPRVVALMGVIGVLVLVTAVLGMS